jgi:uncharacterized iron-regulated protein
MRKVTQSIKKDSMNMNLFKALSIAIVLGATAASADEWQTDLKSNNPIVGKIWSNTEERFITLQQLLNELKKRDWLLLGENHEADVHHALQTEIIEILAQQNQLGNVAFEMANVEQQAALDKALGAPTTPEKLNWQKGWPWEWYESPVNEALTKAERVLGTDLTRQQQMQAYMDEAIDHPNESYKNFMLDILYDGHCGKLPKSQLSNMLNVQIARDREMGRILTENSTDKVDIYIAGNMHVRKDAGVPFHNTLDSLSIMLLSVGDSRDPFKIVPGSYQDNPITDYVIFTPEVEQRDHCSRIQGQSVE